MGLFSKLKNTLFKDDDDNLINEEKSLKSLNPNLQRKEPEKKVEEKEVKEVVVEEVKVDEKPAPEVAGGEEEEIDPFLVAHIREEHDKIYEPGSGEVHTDYKEFRPMSFKETNEISNAIMRGYKVTVDTSLMKKEEIVRMIDFLSGLMMALKGEIIRNSKYIFTFYVK